MELGKAYGQESREKKSFIFPVKIKGVIWYFMHCFHFHSEYFAVLTFDFYLLLAAPN
jgi:hypothetical protein